MEPDLNGSLEEHFRHGKIKISFFIGGQQKNAYWNGFAQLLESTWHAVAKNVHDEAVIAWGISGGSQVMGVKKKEHWGGLYIAP